MKLEGKGNGEDPVCIAGGGAGRALSQRKGRVERRWPAHISTHLPEVKSMMDADIQALFCITFCSVCAALLVYWLFRGGEW